MIGAKQEEKLDHNWVTVYASLCAIISKVGLHSDMAVFIFIPPSLNRESQRRIHEHHPRNLFNSEIELQSVEISLFV